MNDRGIETVMDPVFPSEGLFEMGEAISWSRRLKENRAYKGSRDTIE
jgi:hypothetical protein